MKGRFVIYISNQAFNIVIRMETSLRYPLINRFFFTDRETRALGAGITLWRGYFQSVRPTIDRVLINIDISTGAMYKSGRLVDLALEFLNISETPNALAPRHGLPYREYRRLQRFISGIKVVISRTKNLNRPRLVKNLTREGARDRNFETGDGQIITVAEYFQKHLNIPLQFPDVICAEVCTKRICSISLTRSDNLQLSTGAIIPLELCMVPPGQAVRKDIPQDKIRSIPDFSMVRPHERMRSIRNGLEVCSDQGADSCLLTVYHQVLQYGQSEYVRQFGINVSDTLLDIEARVIKPPTLKYNPSSKQPNVVCKFTSLR